MLRILNFKTTWSEFQKPSLTVAKRGEAELRILDFKTTWLDFQNPSQTPTEQGEAKPRARRPTGGHHRAVHAVGDRGSLRRRPPRLRGRWCGDGRRCRL